MPEEIIPRCDKCGSTDLELTCFSSTCRNCGEYVNMLDDMEDDDDA